RVSSPTSARSGSPETALESSRLPPAIARPTEPIAPGVGSSLNGRSGPTPVSSATAAPSQFGRSSSVVPTPGSDAAESCESDSAFATADAPTSPASSLGYDLLVPPHWAYTRFARHTRALHATDVRDSPTAVRLNHARRAGPSCSPTGPQAGPPGPGRNVHPAAAIAPASRESRT